MPHPDLSYVFDLDYAVLDSFWRFTMDRPELRLSDSSELYFHELFGKTALFRIILNDLLQIPLNYLLQIVLDYLS